MTNDDNALFASLLEGAADPALAVAFGGTILWCNTAFSVTFGHPPDGAAGQNIRTLLVHKKSSEAVASIFASLARGENVRLPLFCKSKGGEEVHTDCSAHPLPQLNVYLFQFRDISASVQTITALNQNGNNAYRKLFENAVEGIFRTTPEGRYLDCNPALARIYGFASAQELIQNFSSIANQLYVNPARREDFKRIMADNGEVWDFESQIYRKDKSIIWISENAWGVRDDAGEITCYEGTVVDITTRKCTEAELAMQREHSRQLFANAPQAIVRVDRDGYILEVNKGFETLFGLEADKVVGRRNREVVVPDDLHSEAEQFNNHCLQGASIEKETFRQHLDGRRIPVQVIGYPITLGGKVNGIFYNYVDITERHEFQEQLQHQAFHDSLTGLPNRALFMERLDRAVQRLKRREDYSFAVFMIDLNRFKIINDSLGHQAGDKMLMGVARRIQSCIRSVDTVARLGGDEFAVLLEEYLSPQDVAEVAIRIHEVMEPPFSIGGQELVSRASIGIVLKTEDYKTAEDILRDADIAMYRAKEKGRARKVRFKIFNKRMLEKAEESMHIEHELRHAITNNELELHYQPIVSVEDQELLGFEALVRWNHPRRGLVGPDRFIPIAEETGMIGSLGRWVLQNACEQMREWREEFPELQALTMSVNVSSKQLGDPELVEDIKNLLANCMLPAGCLKLEITESVFMQETPRATETIRALKELGLQIVVDDFGTGYSSLSYLKLMPVDMLKIDRSFISGQGEITLEIVKTIINLAKNLGLKVVAEGVESEDQLRHLVTEHCDEAQGYMFSKPVDSYKAGRLIDKLRKRPPGELPEEI